MKYLELFFKVKTAIQNHCDDSSSSAWMIIMHVTKKSKAQLLASHDEISLMCYTEIEHIVNQLIVHHQPIQYLTNPHPFASLTLFFEPPTLIARPETEEWVLFLIQVLQPVLDAPLTILDIGTGSGCIALALAKHFKYAQIYAIDIQDSALALTQKNAEINTITNVTILKSDLFSRLPHDLQFDLIVSNPPYISKNEFEMVLPMVKNWEDTGALLAAEDGYALLFAIIKQSSVYLNKKSILNTYDLPRLFLEIGYMQKEKVVAKMKEEQFVRVETRKDQFGNDRVVFGTKYDSIIK